MTKEEWLEKARGHRDELLHLIAHYHPRSDGFRTGGMKITAVAAEAACQSVRAVIAKEAADQPPTVAFEEALNDENVAAISSALSDAWFGVPESTDCWKIRGFGVAMDFMDDPPEEEE